MLGSRLRHYRCNSLVHCNASVGIRDRGWWWLNVTEGLCSRQIFIFWWPELELWSEVERDRSHLVRFRSCEKRGCRIVCSFRNVFERCTLQRICGVSDRLASQSIKPLLDRQLPTGWPDGKDIISTVSTQTKIYGNTRFGVKANATSYWDGIKMSGIV